MRLREGWNYIIIFLLIYCHDFIHILTFVQGEDI